MGDMKHSDNSNNRAHDLISPNRRIMNSSKKVLLIKFDSKPGIKSSTFGKRRGSTMIDSNLIRKPNINSGLKHPASLERKKMGPDQINSSSSIK